MHLECPICFSKYNSGNRKPLNLKCNHTQCYMCTYHLVETAMKAGVSIYIVFIYYLYNIYDIYILFI